MSKAARPTTAARPAPTGRLRRAAAPLVDEAEVVLAEAVAVD